MYRRETDPDQHVLNPMSADPEDKEVGVLSDGKSKQDLLSGDPTKIHLFTAQDFSIKICWI